MALEGNKICYNGWSYVTGWSLLKRALLNTKTFIHIVYIYIDMAVVMKGLLIH